jgi:putative transposase
VKYTWIRDHQNEFPISVSCDVLKVSASGYYAWLHSTPKASTPSVTRLVSAVTRSHLDSDRVYGYRKVWEVCVTGRLSAAGKRSAGP